jgi:4-hydroxyproline epimerase
VKLTNVASYFHAEALRVDLEGFGEIVVDVAYGGNFYAIVEPQWGYADLSDLSPGDILRLSPKLRAALNAAYEFVHLENASIRGLSHILWTGRPRTAEGTHRNAVFYGDKAIDRSPCGTGTSARMAQLHAKGALKPGDRFAHESIIGSIFLGTIEEETRVGPRAAIRPGIEGWAVTTGLNTIFVDPRDPYAHGFQVI